MKNLLRKFLFPLALILSLPQSVSSNEISKEDNSNFHTGISVGLYGSPSMSERYGLLPIFRPTLGVDLSKNLTLELRYSILDIQTIPTLISEGIEGLVYAGIPLNEKIKFLAGMGFAVVGAASLDRGNMQSGFGVGPVFSVGGDVLLRERETNSEKFYFRVDYRDLGKNAVDTGGFSVGAGVRIGF